MSAQLMGILDELVSGRWTNPETGEIQRLPIDNIAIEESLAGQEAKLLRDLHGDARFCVVCDQVTKDILAQRVQDSLGGDSELLVLDSPRASDEHAAKLRERTKDHAVLVAVGSGSLSDLVKYATFLDGKQYSVFATSPMNAYSTVTASISVDGIKRSIKAHNARGVFFDMEVLAGCPARLRQSALADVVCRTTAQVDWLLAEAMWGTRYSELPYVLLAHDEPGLLASAHKLHDGDIAVLASLVRTCVLNGLGTLFTGTTHSGSMAEHQISHYLDNFAGDSHPGTLHGEQVGVATLTVLRLQNRILGSSQPPALAATRHSEQSLAASYDGHAAEFMRNISDKRFSAEKAQDWNERWAQNWDEFAAPLRAVMLPAAKIEKALAAAGCATTPTQLGFDEGFYDQAVHGARFLRDRFSILDLADDAGVMPHRTS